MGHRTSLLAIFTFVVIILAPPCLSLAENPMMMGLCQELVNNARSYEQRAASHASAAKNIMVRIEAVAKQEKTEQTIAAMDTYFKQYDQHRAMERKFRELYKKATEEAKYCMKSLE